MKKIGLGILVALGVLAISGAVAQALTFVVTEVEPSGVTVTVPDIAADKAKALGVEPGTLEKTVFIHYANGKSEVKGKTSAPTCYKLMNVQWKSLPVSYVINPNNSGLTGTFVKSAIDASTITWDAAISKNLFGVSAINTSADWDSKSPDGINEYSFGNYPQSGVIAVTVVWSGIPLGGRGRQIVDFDVMFDTDYIWGDATQNPAVMDLQNIATHETGHGLGLSDIYTSACSAVTMYGYSNYGETQKRTLEQPDITGLQQLYGR